MVRQLSFVMPAFNEEGNIAESIRRCVSTGVELGLDFEVVVVDDGSSDDTRTILQRCCEADPRVRAVLHAKNGGYGAALRSGLLAARKDHVFFTDADLQFDLKEISRLLAKADRYDIVAGYRSPRRDPLVRRFNGWAWSRLVGFVFGLQVRDVDCAFKLFDRQVFEQVPIYSLGAFINTEILVRARAKGFSVTEVAVSHFPRSHGEQSGANLRVIAKAFRELFSLRRELLALDAQSTGPTASRERSSAAE